MFYEKGTPNIECVPDLAFVPEKEPVLLGAPKVCAKILKFEGEPGLNSPFKSLNILGFLHSDDPNTESRNPVKGCLDSKNRTEDFGGGDIRSGGLKIDDDSDSGNDAKFRSSVGEYKVEELHVDKRNGEELKVEGNSASDDHTDPRNPVDELNIECTKVGDCPVDSFKAEDDSASHTSDVESLKVLDDSAAATSEKSPPSSSESSDLEKSGEIVKFEDVSPTEVQRASINDLPTEILQQIFMELPTLKDAKRINETCRRMRDAFKSYEHGLTWAILSRDLGPLLAGTLGALAIFASSRKGRFDEPLLQNMGISTRYWGKMLREHDEKAKKLLTPARADRMLDVYQRFPRMVRCGPSGSKWCSACRSSALAEADWNPTMDSSNSNCMQHLLQANAVRWRLNCRMVMDFWQLSEVLEDVPDDKWDWDPQPVVRDIMRRVEYNPDEASEVEDDIAQDNNIGSEHDVELDHDSGYGGDSEVEDVADLNDGQLDDISHEPKVCSEDAVYHEDGVRQRHEAHSHDNIYPKDENGKKENDHPGGAIQQQGQFEKKGQVLLKGELHQKVEVYQEDEIHSENPDDRIRQEIELLEQEEKEIRVWFQSHHSPC